MYMYMYMYRYTYRYRYRYRYRYMYAFGSYLAPIASKINCLLGFSKGTFGV